MGQDHGPISSLPAVPEIAGEDMMTPEPPYSDEQISAAIARREPEEISNALFEQFADDSEGAGRTRTGQPPCGR